jgi:hypothetical protein
VTPGALLVCVFARNAVRHRPPRKTSPEGGRWQGLDVAARSPRCRRWFREFGLIVHTGGAYLQNGPNSSAKAKRASIGLRCHSFNGRQISWKRGVSSEMARDSWRRSRSRWQSNISTTSCAFRLVYIAPSLTIAALAAVHDGTGALQAMDGARESVAAA